LTVEELSSFYNLRKTEIEKLLQMREAAAEYLRSRNKENRWSELGGKGKYAFEELADGLRGLVGEDSLLFQKLSFGFIDDPTGGRLYEQIPKLRRDLTLIKAQLLRELPVDKPTSSASGPTNVSHDDDPLAANSATNATTGYDLAKALDSAVNLAAAIEVAREEILSQDAFRRERSSANALLAKLRRAHSALTEAATGCLRSDVDVEGAAEQLALIEQRVGQIYEFLNQHRSNPLD
jgi:hypothetical protein